MNTKEAGLRPAQSGTKTPRQDRVLNNSAGFHVRTCYGTTYEAPDSVGGGAAQAHVFGIELTGCAHSARFPRKPGCMSRNAAPNRYYNSPGLPPGGRNLGPNVRSRPPSTAGGWHTS